jgi:hypothetical protein
MNVEFGAFGRQMLYEQHQPPLNGIRPVSRAIHSFRNI